MTVLVPKGVPRGAGATPTLCAAVAKATDQIPAHARQDGRGLDACPGPRTVVYPMACARTLCAAPWDVRLPDPWHASDFRTIL
jgi:hypothetical protein